MFLISFLKFKSNVEILTKRELEIAEMVCLGYSNKIIMEKLTITEQTVKSHLNAIYKKLDIGDRLQLCTMAISTNRLKLHKLLQPQTE